MKNILLTLTLFTTTTLNAQYYYNDIVGTRDINERMKSLLAAKVQTVTATGYDPRGAKATDFNEWQDVQTGSRILKITTRSGQSASRVYYQFDTDIRLISTRDSATNIESISDYRYDATGNLVSIKTTTRDGGQDFNETEERQWRYNTNNKPEKMLRIVNGRDSIEYTFSFDEKGNVADEQLTRRAVGSDPVYYYYDEKNRVSDIVRYDKKVKKLLPEVMFEYDENDRVIQRITTLSTRPPDYLIWRYAFNEKGLKTKEAMFNKNKELKGRIDYTYTYSQ